MHTRVDNTAPDSAWRVICEGVRISNSARTTKCTLETTVILASLLDPCALGWDCMRHIENGYGASLWLWGSSMGAEFTGYLFARVYSQIKALKVHRDAVALALAMHAKIQRTQPGLAMLCKKCNLHKPSSTTYSDRQPVIQKPTLLFIYKDVVARRFPTTRRPHQTFVRTLSATHGFRKTKRRTQFSAPSRLETRPHAAQEDGDGCRRRGARAVRAADTTRTVFRIRRGSGT